MNNPLELNERKLIFFLFRFRHSYSFTHNKTQQQQQQKPFKRFNLISIINQTKRNGNKKESLHNPIQFYNFILNYHSTKKLKTKT